MIQPIEDQPDVVQRALDIGVEFDFSFFEAEDDDRDTMNEALVRHLSRQWNKHPPKQTAIESLKPLGLTKETFLGDWYDAQGRTIKQPRPQSYSRHPETGALSVRDAEPGTANLWAWSDPEPPGQFAYAFARPPHGVSGSIESVDLIFNDLIDDLLPDCATSTILDWNDGSLGDVSTYFEPGLEWWGVYLFTIFTPALNRLIVLSAATTD